MKSIKELDKLCKIKGKRIVIDGNTHKGYVADEALKYQSGNTLATKMHNKHKKGRVW